MKMRPIIMSDDSVRAILDGRKTQTRRVLKCKRADGPCPYGAPGDLLWVREAWREIHNHRAGEVAVVYRASDPANQGATWKSPIYMPREASRLTLRITGIRKERVAEISDDDAIAEGWDSGTILGPRAWYMRTWNAINAKRGHPWESNPLVWVVNFEVVDAAQ